MENKEDKFGIIFAIAITAGALVFVGNAMTNPENISMQQQGEKLLEQTSEELAELPSTIASEVSDVRDTVDEITDEIEEIAESQGVSELTNEVTEDVEEIMPEVPVVIQQGEGKLLELIAIPEGTAIPGCEQANTCYIPSTAYIQAGGELIWENKDSTVHTVTSGTPKSGPTVLFDSGLINPGDTYSVKLDLEFEYDYFCLIHPWMTGMVVVQ